MRSRRSLLATIGTGAALASTGVASAGRVDLTSIRERIEDESVTAGGSTASGAPSGAVTEPDPTNWPGFQFDAANTGTNTAGDPIGGKPERRWRVDTGCCTATHFSDPRVVDGVVYDAFSSFEGTHSFEVRAYDAASGDPIWRSPIHDAANGLSIADGWCHVTTQDVLYKFDAASGERLDTRDLSGEGQTSPTVVDGTVYLSLLTDLEEKEGVLLPYSDGAVVAIDAASYERHWRHDSRRSNSMPTPAVADGFVYAASTDGVLELDAADGSEERTFGPAATGEAPVVRDGTLITSNVDTIAAFDLASGDRRWIVGPDQSEEYNEYHGPPIFDGERVYAWRNSVGSERPPEVVAIDAAAGDIEWTFGVEPKCATTGWKPGFARVGGELIALDEECRFFGLDPATGDERWGYDPFGDDVRDRTFEDLAAAGGTIYAALDFWHGTNELWAIEAMDE